MNVKLGLCSMYPAPGILERIAPDWDWVWLDGQHGQIAGYTEMLAMVRACNLVNRPAFVRVPGHDSGMIGLALDTCAAGVIVPQVETPEHAHAVVRAAKFPPLGNRSYGSRRNIDLSGRLYSATANTDTMLVCQIESPGAVELADEIAAIEGVDALFLGPDDLLLRSSFAMDAKPDETRETVQKFALIVADACRKHGKQAFCVGMGEVMAKFYMEAGYQWIVAGGDVPFLANTSRATSSAIREAISTASTQNSKPGSAAAPTLY